MPDHRSAPFVKVKALCPIFLAGVIGLGLGYQLAQPEEKIENKTAQINEEVIRAHPMYDVLWQACNKAILPRFKESPGFYAFALGAYLGDVQACSEDATQAYIAIERQNPLRHKYF
jgi:hypothetical protein